ncbi:MAG: PhzF family phenazine biosynthesis protein [Candidatus Eremiobacteraeota bacterium]|nr:PhzF family phenazine biosynthesis protein [Candidatus Eremiobacteraeota bacterium]
MKIPIYHVDAFTRKTFGGNPAAVCALEDSLDTASMQNIAAEINLPATAFLAPGGSNLALRWFTATGELELCGHATLATGFVVLNRLEPHRDRVAFSTRAGPLSVERDGDRLALDVPALPVSREHPPAVVAQAIGVMPVALWEGDRAMAVLERPEHVRDLRPTADAIAALPFSALIVTAPGFDGDCDFVSRYFAPKYGLREDYVTGSAHCVLAPYWAGVLGKKRLFARQLSSRGGELWVEDRGDRVRIAGTCVPVLEGTLTIP